MSFKKFAKTQKFRVISGQVSFYAKKSDIDWGIGCFSSFNRAVEAALEALTKSKIDNYACSGICGSWLGHQIQLDAV